MKLSLLTAMLLVSGYVASYGKTVPVDVAKTVGYHHLLQNGSPATLQADELQLVYTSGSSTAFFYVFSGKNCFVIVSADDAVTPVLGYATDNAYNGNKIPPHIAGFLENYNQQIDYVVTSHIDAPAGLKVQWDNLKSAAPVLTARKTTAVNPLLRTKWDQLSGFNIYCPLDVPSGNKVPTGCVATAMAQLMKYWNWPEHGSGSHSYTPSGYGTQSADFGSTTYDWVGMPDHGSNSESARLMYHAGVAVNMMYAPGGSAAYSEGNDPSAEYALRTYFCYSSNLHSVLRSSISDALWLGTIQNELNAGRPVMYSGRGGGTGHSFVVDGYDAANMLHCNFGWGGTDNGYYNMNSIAPPSSVTNFNSEQAILVDVYPNAPYTWISSVQNVCVGYQVGLVSAPEGGAWTSSNPSVASVNSSGQVTGVSTGSAIIKYSVPGSCGNSISYMTIGVVNGTVKAVSSIASGLNGPAGVVTDGSGNVYFSDQKNHKVKKMSSTGAVTTVAGTGSAAYSGDGGQATGASLNMPLGLALDGAGNLYIADKDNNRIRKVTPSGIITTIAGNGTGYTTGNGGPATAAGVAPPTWIAITSSGTIYFTDYYCVRKISTSGIISNIAGNGIPTSSSSGDGGQATAATFSWTEGLTVDGAGNVYLAANNHVRKINTAGIISTIAGNAGYGDAGDGGQASSAQLKQPAGLVFDGAGNLYISDKHANTIRRISTSGIITTVVGNGTSGYSGDGGDPLDASFDIPVGIAGASGKLYIADFNNNRVRMVSDVAVNCAIMGATEIPAEISTFKLYPNPNNGSFTIEVPEAGNTTIVVADISGRVVKTVQLADNKDKKIIMDLGTMQTGIYFVRVSTGQSVYREKIFMK